MAVAVAATALEGATMAEMSTADQPRLAVTTVVGIGDRHPAGVAVRRGLAASVVAAPNVHAVAAAAALAALASPSPGREATAAARARARRRHPQRRPGAAVVAVSVLRGDDQTAVAVAAAVAVAVRDGLLSRAGVMWYHQSATNAVRPVCCC